MSPNKLRLLIVEDSENDFLLLIHHLKKDGWLIDNQIRVENDCELKFQLESHQWDLVISDHNMPCFTSSEAIKIIREHDEDLPVIIVSGDISESQAVHMMEQGASDYIMKDNLARLSPAIRRELAVAKSRRERKRAEVENLAKSEFLAMMSHEIRTPMNAIIGFAEVALLDQGLSSKTLKNIENIHHSAQALLAIINEILDLSKLESGKLDLEEKPFHLCNLIDESCELFRQQALQKSLQLSTQYDETLPEYVLGDPTRISQILINLIGNAIKFTDTGKIEVTCKLLKKINHIHFVISDTGIGLTQAQIEKIFDRFTQADSSTTRLYGGTGLGTSISKQLIEQMHGKIWVESEPGKGSDFHFIIPLPETQPSSTASHHMPEAPVLQPVIIDKTSRQHGRIDILLAEDNIFNQELIKQQLNSFGYSVDIAENGEIAINKWRKANYRLIISDIGMPVINGCQLLQLIREEEKHKQSHVPIIALTANAMSGEKENCLSMGFDDYYSKPLNLATLGQLLQKWMQP